MCERAEARHRHLIRRADVVLKELKSKKKNQVSVEELDRELSEAIESAALARGIELDGDPICRCR